MLDFDDAIISKRMRQILKIRRIKLSDLSRATGIPYRTLQNQFSGQSKFSALNLLLVMEQMGVNSSLITNETSKIDTLTLAMAIAKLLGEKAPKLTFRENGEIEIGEPIGANPKDIWTNAEGLAKALDYEFSLQGFLNEPPEKDMPEFVMPWEKKEVPQ